jgi:hypothetical protein
MPPHDKIPRKLKYSNQVEYMDIKISFSWLKLILIITLFIRDDYFLFGLVFIKKNNQTNFFLKKPKPNRNRFKPTGFSSGSGRFFRIKANSNRFGSVFSGLA